MNNYLQYLLELNLVLSILYLFYILIFRHDANFTLRRFYLLFAMSVSVIFPLLDIDIRNTANLLSSSIITLEEILVSDQSETFSQSLDHAEIITFLVLALSFLFFIRIPFMIARILCYAKKSSSQYIKDTRILKNKKLHASSFFSLIFLDPVQLSAEDSEMIINHERSHARLLHSLDRIMIETILSFTWYNPLVWLFRKELISNHEYQADEKVIETGTDRKRYQLSILNQYIGSASIANTFRSQIKNRILMLNRNYKKSSAWKSLALLPVAALLFFFVACSNQEKDSKSDKQKESTEEKIHYTAEEMPRWADGSDMISSVRKYIAKHVLYPLEAKENNVQGKVFVHFIVTKTGEIKIPEPHQLPPEKTESGDINEVVVVAYRPISEDDPIPDEKHIQLLKDEARRVVSSMPKMIPGKDKGKPVNVIYTLPISFVLQ